jgi:hypothetical protein
MAVRNMAVRNLAVRNLAVRNLAVRANMAVRALWRAGGHDFLAT